MGYIRFAISRLDPDSGRRQGVLQAAFELREAGELSPEEEKRFKRSMLWLDAYLPAPSRFSRKRNNAHRTPMGLSWFKDTAHKHIAQVRRIITILEAHGIQVNTIKSTRPGYIVYEDEFQVVAEPFADSGA